MYDEFIKLLMYESISVRSVIAAALVVALALQALFLELILTGAGDVTGALEDEP